MNWKYEDGDWTRFRKLPGVVEVDFHRSGQSYEGHYDDMMNGIAREVLDTLQQASEDGTPYVLFIHGWSTSGRWSQRTSRSTVRGVMRSPEATRWLFRRECIQHETVFVAAIRPKDAGVKTLKSKSYA